MRKLCGLHIALSVNLGNVKYLFYNNNINISKTHNVSKNVESEALKSKPLSSSAVTKYYRISVGYDRVWSGTCMCNEYIEHKRPQYNLLIS